MNEIMEIFFSKRPEMQKKSKFPGTFDEYASNLAKSIKTRNEKGVLSGIILKEVTRLLFKEKSIEALERQLSKFPIISCADHLGLLNYKLLYNSNLLYAQIIRKMNLPFVITLATGSVPMVNKSHPRGFYFKGEKFNFFAERKSKMPVMLFESKLCADRKQGIDSLISSYNKNLISQEEKKFLAFLFFDGLEVEKAGETYETYSDQLTFLNYKIWKFFFDKSIRDTIPDIIYLQSDPIYMEILIEEMKKKDSLISLILFDPQVRKEYLKNFQGIACCWGENMGSHLLWGIGENKKFISLRFDEASNKLIGEDFSIKLEADIISEALKSKKIFPTIFLDFVIVTFLEGYLTLGGFNQLEYLAQMQQAHVKSLKEIGMNDMAELFAARVTDGMICGMFPLEFDSAIDMIWHYNSHNGKFNGNLDGGLKEEDLEKIRHKKVKDMITSAIETMMENISPTE